MLLLLGDFALTYTIIVYTLTFLLIIAIILYLFLGCYFVESPSGDYSGMSSNSLILFLWWRLLIELCSPAEFFKTSSDTLSVNACLFVTPLLFYFLILLLFFMKFARWQLWLTRTSLHSGKCIKTLGSIILSFFVFQISNPVWLLDTLWLYIWT